MPATLRFPRAFATTCAIGLAAALPIACAQGSSGYGLIGLGGDTVTGSGGRESSGASSGEMSSSSTSSSSSGHTSSSSSGHTSSSTSSSTSGFSSSSSSSTSSSSGSSSCDNTDCNTCVTCAESLPSCALAFDDCVNDFGCTDILFCVECTCAAGDAVCVQQCIANDPGTSAGYFNAWLSCLACACQQTCGAASGC
jgi:hypothetical protein